MVTARYLVWFIAMCMLPILFPRVHTLQPRQQDSARVATLIAMGIRLPRDFKEREVQVQKLNNMTSGSDVFICTDQESAHDIGIFSNLAAVRILTKPWPGVADISIGNNTIQWYRLQKCWDLVQEYERRNGLNYSFIVKLRTDCDIHPGIQCLKYNANAELLSKVSDDTAFIYSDYQFGAGRKVFSRIASLYTRIETDYWGRDAQYVNIDWGLVSKCDISAGRFEWLAYPKDAMGHPPCFSFACISQNKQLLEWSHMHSEEDAKHVECVTRKEFTSPGVSSEKIMVLDLLRSGFTVQSFRHFSGDMRLFESFETAQLNVIK